MDDETNELGSQIRRGRLARGLTQRQTAKMVGCSYSTLWRVEAGRQVPGPELLVRLADLIRLDVRELLQAAGYPVPDDLPELGTYVRMKFKNDLPPHAFGEIESFVAFLRSKYGASSVPTGGADEHPEGMLPPYSTPE